VKHIQRLLAGVVIAILLVMATFPVAARQVDGKYFPETGHTVAGDFWRYYQSLPEPALVLGYPITDAFVTNNPKGLLVQYFQRARLEFHPELLDGQRITLTNAGTMLYAAGNPSIPVNAPGACRSFATGFSICYDFLAFFDAHGGLTQFGNPISMFEILADGRIVQYFERARLEWHPEMARGSNIILSDVGRLLFDKLGENPLLLSAVLSEAIIDEVLSLRTTVFFWKAVSAPNDIQRIYVIVQSQTFQPVEGATVRMLVHLPTGEQVFELQTNALGVATVEFTFSRQTAGNLVSVNVSVGYRDLAGGASGSFRIWH
jgi:hypothetical protein